MRHEEEIIFLGEFEHSLDAQRRLAIPRGWRVKGQVNRYIIVPGRGRTLQLIPFASFKENFLEKAKKVSLANSEGALALARFASRAQECKCDKQGRIQLSEALLNYAGLKNPVSLVGALWFAQIWDRDKWAGKHAGDESYFDELEKISEAPGNLADFLEGTIDSLKDSK
jgi:MraZ protein